LSDFLLLACTRWMLDPLLMTPAVYKEPLLHCNPFKSSIFRHFLLARGRSLSATGCSLASQPAQRRWWQGQRRAAQLTSASRLEPASVPQLAHFRQLAPLERTTHCPTHSLRPLILSPPISNSQ
jgi:hypothetical protein